MDGNDFDSLAKRLAESGSRRKLLHGVIAAAAASIATATGLDAKKRNKRGKVRAQTDCHVGDDCTYNANQVTVCCGESSNALVCFDNGKCNNCRGVGHPCPTPSQANECCPDLICGPAPNPGEDKRCCRPTNSTCSKDDDCCGTDTCQAGTCKPPQTETCSGECDDQHPCPQVRTGDSNEVCICSKVESSAKRRKSRRGQSVRTGSKGTCVKCTKKTEAELCEGHCGETLKNCDTTVQCPACPQVCSGPCKVSEQNCPQEKTGDTNTVCRCVANDVNGRTGDTNDGTCKPCTKKSVEELCKDNCGKPVDNCGTTVQCPACPEVCGGPCKVSENNCPQSRTGGSKVCRCVANDVNGRTGDTNDGTCKEVEVCTNPIHCVANGTPGGTGCCNNFKCCDGTCVPGNTCPTTDVCPGTCSRSKPCVSTQDGVRCKCVFGNDKKSRTRNRNGGYNPVGHCEVDDTCQPNCHGKPCGASDGCDGICRDNCGGGCPNTPLPCPANYCGPFNNGCQVVTCNTCGGGGTCISTPGASCLTTPCCNGLTCCSGTCVLGNNCGGTGCVPKTCQQLGFNCGVHSNGCNASLDCGTCPTGQNCDFGVCKQGPCIPDTCASLGRICGSASDGCGTTLQCGTCQSNETCTPEGACVQNPKPPKPDDRCPRPPKDIMDRCKGKCKRCPRYRFMDNHNVVTRRAKCVNGRCRKPEHMMCDFRSPEKCASGRCEEFNWARHGDPGRCA